MIHLLKKMIQRGVPSSATPTGLNTTPWHCATPLGLMSFLPPQPRVARIRATLGFDVKPLWGFMKRIKLFLQKPKP